MSQRSSFKLRALQLTLTILILLAVFSTMVLAQTAQPTPAPNTSPVVYTPVVGSEPRSGKGSGSRRHKRLVRRHKNTAGKTFRNNHKARYQTRVAVAYTPITGITVMQNPDTDSNDPAP